MRYEMRPEPLTVRPGSRAGRAGLQDRDGTPGVAATLLWRVKAAVDRLGKRGVLAGTGKPARWAVTAPP
jgi:hypothetical protein